MTVTVKLTSDEWAGLGHDLVKVHELTEAASATLRLLPYSLSEGADADEPELAVALQMVQLALDDAALRSIGAFDTLFDHAEERAEDKP